MKYILILAALLALWLVSHYLPNNGRPADYFEGLKR